MSALEAARRLLAKDETVIGGVTASGKMWFRLQDIETVTAAFIKAHQALVNIERRANGPSHHMGSHVANLARAALSCSAPQPDK